MVSRNGIKPLNIFYEEPDPDRWFKFDRYPRRLIRRILRGREKPGSIMMVALGLMKGLDKLSIPYRFNDHRYIHKHPEEIACIIGKPHLLDKYKWNNPIVFGAGIFSHPNMYPDLLKRHPNIKKVLVPGPWVREMFIPYYGAANVIAWPVGIDTEKWKPANSQKDVDLLVYAKFLWDKEANTQAMLQPILAELQRTGLTYEVITYGQYTHAQLKATLDRAKAAIFLCEHESQGMAYQQMLATDVPLLAWDREDFWLDPSFYPHDVKFKPVSAVPYWDERCGLKFKNLADFKEKLPLFIAAQTAGEFSPRAYILANLTLEKCAQDYLNIISAINEDPSNR